MLCYAESMNGYFLVLPNVDLKLLLTDAKRQKKKRHVRIGKKCPHQEIFHRNFRDECRSGERNEDKTKNSG